MTCYKILKIVVLSLCLCLLLCLAACKGGSAPDGTDSYSSTFVQSGDVVIDATSDNADNTEGTTTNKKPSSDNKVSQGIELKEDVFENSDAQSGGNTQSKPQSNLSNNNTSSNNAADDNQSDGNVSGGNQPDSNISDDSESNDNVSDDNQSNSDGTVKLPVVWFD